MNSIRRHRVVFALIMLALTHSSLASANVGEAFGFGSKAAALAGVAVAPLEVDAFAAYNNPAALALRPAAGRESDRLTLSWGIVAMEPVFLPISNVTITNSFTLDSARTGDVDVTYRTTFGQSLGLSYRVFDSHRLTLGVVTFLPFSHLAFVDTGEAFIPEYVLYRARTQRPQVEAGVGAELGGGWHAGFGLHFSFGLTSNANVLLQTNDAKPSIMRFSATMKMKASPYLGVLFRPTDSLSSGLTLRFPATAQNSITVNSGAAVLVPDAIVDFRLAGNSALFYDPLTVELGTSWRYLPGLKLSAQLDYQLWSRFKPPVIQVENLPEGGVPISPSRNPELKYRDIPVPRIGHEYQVGDATWRLGYAYRPSILSELPNGAGNLLDPPKHIITAGLGLRFAHFLHFDVPCSLDIHAAFHQLVTQDIVKTPGDEAGNLSSSKIGAPGYQAGGRMYGGGVSFSLAI